MYKNILLHVCPWSACMPSTHEGQKKVLDALLQLELMTFWAIMWVPGTEPGSFRKVVSVHHSWVSFPATPYILFFMRYSRYHFTSMVNFKNNYQHAVTFQETIDHGII